MSESHSTPAPKRRLPRDCPTPDRQRPRPAKPSPDFPLFPHAAGVWAKKIRGQLHYFGPWEDPEGALKRYQEQAADLHAGRPPRADPRQATGKDVLHLLVTA